MAFVINVNKWLLWTVYRLYQYVLSRIYYSVLEPRNVLNTMWLVNTPRKHEMLTQCWPTVSPSQFFLLAGACAHSAKHAAADSEMEVTAYFTSVHITVFWNGCDRHCCRQRNGSICLFHKCAYYYRLLEGL